MFGNNGNMQEMMAKLQEMQGSVEKSKERLNGIFVKGETDDKNIRFVMDGNRRLQEITIVNKSILVPENASNLENQLIEAFNKALDNANHVNEAEMKNTAFGMFPGIGL